MRRSRLILLALALVGLVGFISLGLAWGKSLQRPNSVLNRTGTVVQVAQNEANKPNAENVPLYPNRNEWQETSYKAAYQSWETNYAALDPPEKVIAFYKDALTKQGWTVLQDDNLHIYEWRDKDGIASWGLHLSISVGGFYSDKTSVSLHLSRWPDVNKIPIPPSTQPSEVKYGQPERTVTYVTSVKVEEIESYYRSVLEKWGWKFIEEDDRPSGAKRGLYFVDMYNGVTLTVDAHTNQDDQTLVELRFVEIGPMGDI